MKRPAVLFVSYDGMLEPLGQSQVLSYLERLVGRYEIHLLSFEKPDDLADENRLRAVVERIAAAGIRWNWRRYHKVPSVPATLFDIAIGIATAVAISRRHQVRIIHARGYVPALIGLIVKRITGAKLLFDMRGLWADERVDAGLWPAGGGLYRITKSIERRLLDRADHIVTLTHASANEIASFACLRDNPKPITVIPTCADLDRFRRREDPRPRPFTYGFVGAASTWSLFDEVLVSFQLLLEQEPEAWLLVVNRNEHPYILARIAAAGIDRGRVELVAAEHRDVPALISRMDAASALRKQTYSQIACAPTKLAEYLGCGVPCLINLGIGDAADIVQQDQVGIAISGFSKHEMRDAMARLVALVREPGIRERCVDSARKRFSLDDGVAAYAAIYRELLNHPAEAKRSGGQLRPSR